MVDDQVVAGRRGIGGPGIDDRASAETGHPADQGAVGGQPVCLGGVGGKNRRLDPDLREERAEVSAVARELEDAVTAGRQAERNQLADHGARVRRDRPRRGRWRGRRIVVLVRPVAVQLREAAARAEDELQGEEGTPDASDGAG